MENEQKTFIGSEYSAVFELERFEMTRVDDLIDYLKYIKSQGYDSIKYTVEREANYTLDKVSISASRPVYVPTSEKDSPENVELIEIYKDMSYKEMMDTAERVEKAERADLALLKAKYENL